MISTASFWIAAALAGVLGVLFVKFLAARLPWAPAKQIAAAL